MKYKSLSATAFKRGDRVIVRAKRDEWYTGTVKQVTSKKVVVEFDDGNINEYAPDEKWLKRMLIDYKTDDALDDVEATRLYVRAKLASEVKKIRLRLDEPEDESQEPHEPWGARIVTLQRPDLYAPAHGSRNVPKMQRWLNTMYDKLNNELFDDELPRANLVIHSVMDERKCGCNGVWKAKKRELCMGQSLFEHPEFEAMKALIHLMSHQAVSEINHHVGIGHGPEWAHWMYHAGVPVTVTTDLLNDVPAMLRYEPELAEDLPHPPNDVAKERSTTVGLHHFHETPYNATPAIMMASSGVLRRGVLLGQWSRQTDELYFVTVASLDKVQKVRLDQMYQMPEDERDQFITPQWRASVARLTLQFKLKPRLFQIHGQVRCAVCGDTINTQKAPALSIDKLVYDVKHAAEHLNMPEDVLAKMIRNRQITQT